MGGRDQRPVPRQGLKPKLAFLAELRCRTTDQPVWCQGPGDVDADVSEAGRAGTR